MRGWLAVFIVLVGCEAPFDDSPRDAGWVPPPKPLECLALPDLDFGEVPVDALSPRQFTLTNFRTTPTVVEFGAVNPPFVVMHPGPRLIEPSRSIVVGVSFRPTDARLSLDSVTFTGGTGCAPQTIQLRGLGSGSVVAPALLDFGAVPLGTSAVKPLRVTNTRRVPIVASLSVLDPFRAESTLEVPAQSFVELDVAFTPARAGFEVRTLLISDQLGARVEVQLRGVGGVPRAVLSRPRVEIPRVGFFGGSTSSAAERSLFLVNEGDGPLSFREPALMLTAGPNTSLNELRIGMDLPPLMPGERRALGLSLFPESLGPKSWELVLFTNDPATPDLSLPITAFAEALPPCQLMTSGPAVIEDLSVGQSGSTTVGFSNVGTTECVIDDVHLGPSSSWTVTPADEQFSLPAGTTKTLTLSLTAQTPGLNTDVLSYRPFAADGGSLVLPLAARVH